MTVFSCEDIAHADRMLDKLRADFAWDKLTGPKCITLPGGVPAYQASRGSVLTFARQATRVYAIASAGPNAAAASLTKLHIKASTAAFQAQKLRPASLDYYDLRPLSMNFMPFNLRGQHVDGPWDNCFLKSELEKAHAFWQPYGINVNLLDFNVSWGFAQPEPTSAMTFPIDYIIAMGKEHRQSFSAMLGNTPSPWWIRNKFPDQISQFDPNGLPYYGSPLGTGGAVWLSMMATEDAYGYVRKFTGQMLVAIKRDAGDDLAMVRPIAGGRPGDELAFHNGSTEYMEYDPQGQAAFRRWLRDDRKFSLSDLGQRWYGDPGHFKSWDDVTMPSNYEFFGGFGDKDQTFNLLTSWKWRPDRKASNDEGWGDFDYAPGPEWQDVDLAPSYKQGLLLNSQPDDATERIGKTAWFRKEFDLTDWLAAHRRQQVYLVVSTMEYAANPVEIWVNGAYLGSLHPKEVFEGPVAAQITSLVHSGRNVICLKVRDGIIYGPVYLTTHEPKRYPYLGPQENARFIDLRDWSGSERMVESWYREALPMRENVPDLPMCLAPGGYLYADRFAELKKQGGLTEIHDTGGFAGSYSPELSGLTYGQGLYFTNEEGGTITDDSGQTRQLAWFLFEGVSHHNYIDNAQAYMTWEEKSGWFKKHQRLLSLVAKSMRTKPAIAVLLTPETDQRYFPYSDSGVSWDIGRGGLQAAHYNNAYVTGTEVQSGAVDTYPVLFDSNTSVMSDELLNAIERYVRAGGTFIALQGTGRSSLLNADTWPISRLTGFKVVGEHGNGMVTVLKDNPLLKNLAGRKFPGTGMVLNWMGQDHAKDALPIGMKASGEGCTTLAVWEDGATAAGMRTLGKGRVIVLGSTFWASKSDLAGNGYGQVGTVQTNFFNDLFSGLGVVKDLDCTSPDIWTRRVETKNGLQDWMILWNSTPATVNNVSLSFSTPAKPARVVDEETGAETPYTYANGAVSVPRLSVEPNGIRVIGIDRTDIGVSVAHWFGIKARFESAPERTVPIPAYTPPKDDTISVNTYQFRQIDDATVASGSWLIETDTVSPWKTVGCGFWDEQGFAPTGTGVYRTTIQVPALWTGQRICLAMFSPWLVFLGKPEAYVNGHSLGSAFVYPFDPSGTVLDITPYVHPGSNELAFLVKQHVARGGYLGGVSYYAQPDLHDRRKLTFWHLFSDDRNSTAATLPVSEKGRHLAIDTDIPANWDPHQVYLDIDQGSSRWMVYMMVNDRPIAYTWYGHLYPNRIRINLAPWVSPGKTNHIELWGFPDRATSAISLQSVDIGTLLARQ